MSWIIVAFFCILIILIFYEDGSTLFTFNNDWYAIGMLMAGAFMQYILLNIRYKGMIEVNCKAASKMIPAVQIVGGVVVFHFILALNYSWILANGKPRE